MNRAIQVEFLAAGLHNAGGVLAGGKVYTYAAGTTTPKTVWLDDNKTTPATNPIVLDADGRAAVFADGFYKFVVTDATDGPEFTLDDLKYRFYGTNVVTKTANYTATTDDDVILVDATGGARTITLPAAATAVAPITIKKIDASVNAVTIDAFGAETIDGAANISISTQQGVATLYSDGSAWRGNTQITTADTVDGFHASQSVLANTIAVRDSGGNVPGVDAVTVDGFNTATVPTSGTLPIINSSVENSTVMNSGATGTISIAFPDYGYGETDQNTLLLLSARFAGEGQGAMVQGYHPTLSYFFAKYASNARVDVEFRNAEAGTRTILYRAARIGVGG